MGTRREEARMSNPGDQIVIYPVSYLRGCFMPNKSAHLCFGEGIMGRDDFEQRNGGIIYLQSCFQ